MSFKLPGSGLLSYSGMALFLGCPRKYGYRYFDKVEQEVTDTSALDRGRVFHLLVEKNGDVSPHKLATEVGGDMYELAKVTAAYSAYRKMAAALPSLDLKEVKIVSEEHQFIGFVDGIGIEASGQWRLGEMKTTTRFDPLKWATLAINPQIALYTAFAGEFAHGEFLALSDLQGVSYRTVTYSGKDPLEPSKNPLTPKTGKVRKNARLEKETVNDYARRIAGDSQVYHQMVSPTEEARLSALQSFGAVKEAIHDARGRSGDLVKNAGNCHAYGRPCEYFEHCWGLNPEVTEPETQIINNLDDETAEELDL